VKCVKADGLRMWKGKGCEMCEGSRSGSVRIEKSGRAVV
jgi:hypothetical protein